MLGQGHIDQNKLRHHFVFRVAQSDNKDSRFVLGEPIARMPLRRRRQRARGLGHDSTTRPTITISAPR